MKRLAWILCIACLVTTPVMAVDDDFQAIMYWAKKGLSSYQYKVGQFYETGQHTEKNIEKALEWYKRSAANGYIPAIKKLDKLREKTVSRKKKPRKLKPIPAAKPAKRIHKKTSRKAPLPKPKNIVKLPLEALLAAHWETGLHKPAALLPSSITQCSKTSRGTECWSGVHARKKQGQSIRVKTKSYIRDYTQTGFTIRFKDLIQQATDGLTQWEKQTHNLDCSITSPDEIQCHEKNQQASRIFRRVTLAK